MNKKFNQYKLFFTMAFCLAYTKYIASLWHAGIYLFLHGSRAPVTWSSVMRRKSKTIHVRIADLFFFLDYDVCSLTSTTGGLTGVTVLKKFGAWVDGPKGIGKRMPYISVGDDKSLLTTADDKSQDRFGTIVSKVPEHSPAQWIGDSAEDPGIIWYWIKESSTFLQGRCILVTSLALFL